MALSKWKYGKIVLLAICGMASYYCVLYGHSSEWLNISSNFIEKHAFHNEPDALDDMEDSTTRNISKVSKVVIVTYGRSGSTFLAEFFNQNPNAFYLYEPMHGMVSQYYREKEGGKKPNSAVSVQRAYSSLQNQGAASFLRMLDCDFAPLFPRKKDEPALVSFKPDRSFQVEQVLSQCLTKHELWLLGHSNSEKLSSQCIELLNAKCRSSNIRAIKTIRLRMEAAEKLLKADPSVFIIYLTRDPRGSAYSRKNLWLKNLTNEQFIIKTKNMCTDMAVDYAVFKYLTVGYPKRLKHIQYEELALRPMEFARDLYKMLGHNSLPSELATWIEKNTQSESNHTKNYPYDTSRNSSQVANAWKKSIGNSLHKALTDVCKTVLKLLDYDA